ncbi:MAG: F0F1 ATP synthase subunit A [Phycisphaeraceae bacterium]|nr:F0F1 ATP synthase subunit A [Phycisphaeraceae bacterium]
MTTTTLAADPLGHVLDKTLFDTGTFLGAMTMHTVTLFLAALLTIWAMTKAAKAIATGPETMGNDRYLARGPFGQLIEVIAFYMRDTVIMPQLGEKQGRRLTPFLLTLFFFILFNNMLGLVPILDLQHLIGGLGWGDSHFAVVGGTATGRLAVTGGLATIAFIVWQINGIRESGLKGWAAHFMGGAPWYIAPIMVPVELMGMFVKPFALALRLFANMTAGHVLLAVLLGFTAAAPAALGWAMGSPVMILALLGGVAIFFLEIFVGFLQAFIFMFLTTLFIAQLSHHHHDEHEHEHDDHHAHAPAAAH